MLPIIFIHNNNHDYLPLSLWQARRTNPNSEVILIGDDQNRHLNHLVRHVDYRGYFNRAGDFGRRFQNFSTNAHAFELICLQRWFILLEFMEAESMETCLYLDSDVLIYTDVVSEAKRFDAFGMTIAGISGHTNYISNREVLSRFCNFIDAAYAHEEAIAVLKRKYEIFLENHEAGGISDMTFFVEFKEEYPDEVLDIGQKMNQTVYDISMNYTVGLIISNGFKSILWVEGYPHVVSPKTGAYRIHTLHFQGESKPLMAKNIKPFSMALWVVYTLNKLYWYFQRFRKKMGRNKA